MCTQTSDKYKRIELSPEAKHFIARLEQQIRDQWQQLRELEAQRDEAGRRYIAQVQECTDKDRELDELAAENVRLEGQRANWQASCEQNQKRIAELEQQVTRMAGDLAKYQTRPEYLHGYEDGKDSTQGEIAHLREALKRLEWIEYGWTDIVNGTMETHSCPVCHGAKECDGHEPDCWLAKELEGE